MIKFYNLGTSTIKQRKKCLAQGHNTVPLEVDKVSGQILNLFFWFDSLCPSQQFFSHVRTGLPGLNQY